MRWLDFKRSENASGVTPAPNAFGEGAPASGVFPLFMSAIPSETISARYVATTCGLIQGLREAVGGFAAPAVAGKAADVYGLPAAKGIMAGCAIGGAVLSLGLRGRRQQNPL